MRGMVHLCTYVCVCEIKREFVRVRVFFLIFCRECVRVFTLPPGSANQGRWLDRYVCAYVHVSICAHQCMCVRKYVCIFVSVFVFACVCASV